MDALAGMGLQAKSAMIVTRQTGSVELFTWATSLLGLHQ